MRGMKDFQLTRVELDQTFLPRDPRRRSCQRQKLLPKKLIKIPMVASNDSFFWFGGQRDFT